MTSSTERPGFTTTGGAGGYGFGHSAGASPGTIWINPSVQYFPMSPNFEMRKSAHASNDPTIVNHCPFCGSGSLTGRSDGAVDCGVCNETFRVSREPLYSNEPSGEAGAGVESFDNDPLTAEDPFDANGLPADDPNADPEADPEDPAADEDPAGAAPEQDDAAPADPADEGNEEPPIPAIVDLRNKTGVKLDVEDFLLHHAIRSSRGE